MSKILQILLTALIFSLFFTNGQAQKKEEYLRLPARSIAETPDSIMIPIAFSKMFSSRVAIYNLPVYRNIRARDSVLLPAAVVHFSDDYIFVPRRYVKISGNDYLIYPEIKQSKAILYFAAIVGAFLLLFIIVLFIKYRKHNLRAKRAGGSISIVDFILMSVSPVSVSVITDAMIDAMVIGQKLTVKDINKHYKAQGNIRKAVKVLIRAHERANIKINLTDLTEYLDVGLDPETWFDIFINLKKVNLEITKSELKKFCVSIDYQSSDDEKNDVEPVRNNTVGSDSETKEDTAKNSNQTEKTIEDETPEKENVHRELSPKDRVREKVAYVSKEVTQIINLLIRLKKADFDITLSELSQYQTIDEDIEEFVNGLIRAKALRMNIEPEELREYSAKGDAVQAIAILIRAYQAGINISIANLDEYQNLGINAEEFVNSLIKAHQEGLKLAPDELMQYYAVGGDVGKAIELMINAKKQDVPVELNSLKEYFIAKGNIEMLVRALIKSKQAGLGVEAEEMVGFYRAGGDVEQLITTLIKAHQEELELSLSDLVRFNRAEGNIEDFFMAMKINKRSGLGIGKASLFEHHLAGGDVLSLVKVTRTSRGQAFDIELDRLAADLIAGRKVGLVVRAMLQGKRAGIELPYGFGIAIDRSGGDVVGAVKWALNPMIYKTPLQQVIAKDGIELTFEANVTIRGKIFQYFSTSREEILGNRVNEVIISEIGEYNSHKKVVESLNKIAKNVLKRIQEDDELSKSSAYEILDITIPGVLLGKDTYSELKKQMAQTDKELSKTDAEKRLQLAKVLELEAQVGLVQAKAELEKGMAEAFKHGRLSLNDYHKKKSNER